MSVHYCGTDLIDISFFRTPEKCISNTSTPFEGCAYKKINCCSNVLIVEENTELEETPFLKVNFQKLKITFSEIPSIFIFSNKVQNLSFQEYPPPLITSNIQLKNSTFLI